MFQWMVFIYVYSCSINWIQWVRESECERERENEFEKGI